jgi:hypothetical protein
LKTDGKRALEVQMSLKLVCGEIKMTLD